MNIHTLYRPFLRFFRSRRTRLFHELMRPAAGGRILDVGGYHWFWTGMECRNPITCLNTELPNPAEPVPAQFRYVRGDGRHLPYNDGDYDIVFSNSVIEHLGSYEDQRRFASEIRRVGRRYWVQTPNRWFPIEPHLLTPVIHYLPRSVQRRLIGRFTVWGLVTRPTRAQVDAFLSEVRLLTEREMEELFPDARILSERFLGLRKSFIAVKGEE